MRRSCQVGRQPVPERLQAPLDIQWCQGATKVGQRVDKVASHAAWSLSESCEGVKRSSDAYRSSLPPPPSPHGLPQRVRCNVHLC